MFVCVCRFFPISIVLLTSYKFVKSPQTTAPACGSSEGCLQRNIKLRFYWAASSNSNSSLSTSGRVRRILSPHLVGTLFVFLCRTSQCHTPALKPACGPTIHTLVWI
uniref:Putative secreted protein n=1 Tax=Anopheles triannulatus TaxID=58253 RepID=A0A2M4B5H3_9DIPT